MESIYQDVRDGFVIRYGEQNIGNYQAAFRQRRTIRATDAPDSILLSREFRGELDGLLSGLCAQERYFVKKRFGLAGKPQSLAQIAKTRGISKQRTHKILKVVLMKLRKMIERKEDTK